MADRKQESSVLFSLRELRNIEEERVKTEEESVKSVTGGKNVLIRQKKTSKLPGL